nr:proapoptotic nucleolar protein 1 isoform X2 [Camelus dromedarius]
MGPEDATEPLARRQTCRRSCGEPGHWREPRRPAPPTPRPRPCPARAGERPQLGGAASGAGHRACPGGGAAPAGQAHWARERGRAGRARRHLESWIARGEAGKGGAARPGSRTPFESLRILARPAAPGSRGLARPPPGPRKGCDFRPPGRCKAFQGVKRKSRSQKPGQRSGDSSATLSQLATWLKRRHVDGES